MTARTVDVLVVGAGPAGLAAARELASLGVGSVEVVDREGAAGGVPRHCGHTGFGVRDERRLLTGPDYARRIVDAAVAAGASVRVGVSVTGWAGPLTVHTTSASGPELLSARAIVLATGARERPRAARLVPGSRGTGVYTTGQLQQAVYLERQRIGSRAVIVGAEHVSFSAAVTLHDAGVQVVAMTTELERQQSYLAFRAGATVRYRFPVLTGTAVTEVLGRGRVEGVELLHPGGTREIVPCDTVVFSGDWIADHELARTGGLVMAAGSTGPSVDTELRTSVPGVYAVGNLLHPVVTADVAALDGRHVAAAVLEDLVAPDSPWGGGAGVAVEVRAPLRWVTPDRVVDPTVAPPRGRFVLWANEFVAPARVEVRQGDRLLARMLSPRPLVPNRPFEIGAGWLPKVVPGGGPVVIEVSGIGVLGRTHQA